MEQKFNVIWTNITDVKPYEKNAKKHDETQIANVAESIRQFGWQQPIVCDADGVIIIGHCRLLAAKKLGLKKVPVKTVDNLSEEQVKKLRALDNKLGNGNVVFRRHVERGRDDLALDRALHVRHFFGPLVDEQHDQLHIGVVV